MPVSYTHLDVYKRQIIYFPSVTAPLVTFTNVLRAAGSVTFNVYSIKEALLETTIEGASHVIINISGDISLIEANEAASYVQELAGDDANIIFGAMFDETAQDEATITVIATGLDAHGANTSVNKAMAGFNTFKPKMPSNMGLNTAGLSGMNQAAAAAEPSVPRTPSSAPAAHTAHTAPKPASQPAQQQTPSQGAYRPLNREVQINM